MGVATLVIQLDKDKDEKFVLEIDKKAVSIFLKLASLVGEVPGGCADDDLSFLKTPMKDSCTIAKKHS